MDKRRLQLLMLLTSPWSPLMGGLREEEPANGPEEEPPPDLDIPPDGPETDTPF
jgi:hypothetical protein